MVENDYPKINSIFKRDEKGHFINEFSETAFKYLVNNEWYGTEKVDGMNIKIIISPTISGGGYSIEIGGKTDAAHIPSYYQEYFNTVLLKKLLFEVLQTAFPNLKPMTKIVLYGEGYGDKIQKAGKRYLPNGGLGFALFDVKIESYNVDDQKKDFWWLERHNVEDIGKNWISMWCLLCIVVLFGMRLNISLRKT